MLRTIRKRLALVASVITVAVGAILGLGWAAANSAIGAAMAQTNQLISYAAGHAWDCEVVDSTLSFPVEYRVQFWTEWAASSSGSPPATETSVDASWGADVEFETVYQNDDSDDQGSDTWVGEEEFIDEWTGNGGSFASGSDPQFSATAWIYSNHSASWDQGEPETAQHQDWGNTMCSWEGGGNR